MSDSIRAGSCLCGAVQFEVIGEPFTMTYCHCESCRRWVGAPMMGGCLFRSDKVKIVKGADQLTVYKRNPDSGSHRKFCKFCGSALFNDHPGIRMTDVMAVQVPDLELVITPVGGGRLLAGCGLVASDSGVTIYGAEPQGADDAHRSFHSGELVTSHVPETICDGLLTTLGERNFEIIRQVVADILLASDQEIIDAMRLLWTRTKLIVEPSSAVTLAAVLRNSGIFRGKRTGLVLTGGNVDLENLPF